MDADVITEIRRRFDLTINMANSIDTKIGVMLGFSFVILGLVINKDFISLLTQSPVLIRLLFVHSLYCIVVSICSGIAAFYFKPFEMVSTAELLTLSTKPNADIPGGIATSLSRFNSNNSRKVEDKVVFAQVMFVTFSLGLLTIIILEIGCFSGIW